MAEQPSPAPGRVGRVGGCMLHNWAEERAVAALDTPETRSQIRKYGHRGILTTDWESKMESVTTLKATYVTPKSPGVRLRGIRGELLEKQMSDAIRPVVPMPFIESLPPEEAMRTPHVFAARKEHSIASTPGGRREKIHAELNPPSPGTDFCSTTQKDFGVEGFVPFDPETTRLNPLVALDNLKRVIARLSRLEQVHDYKSDQAVTFWSENRQRVQGVTGVQNPKASFRKSARFSTPIGERLEEERPPDN
ncbi:Sperm-associated antigen 8 [Liparis tanakae]|uniref:Sperm-associated antigen 8 n=1 Tax=Liparis tanakae TaxID=230148 RepID=A0A4Z2F7B4_9TELE|nr:Sperm-associated antigen 8 [Liparis tanakae]